jgi:hypothetical protein
VRVIQNRHRVVLIGCVVALVALLGSNVARASRPADEGTVDGVTIDSQGRVHYDVDLTELPGHEIVTEPGLRTSAGTCSFSALQQGVAGEPTVLVVTEVSFDPNTCTRTLARAAYSRDALPPSVREKLADQPGATTDERSSGSTSESEMGIQATWSGSIKVNVEDPPQIDVTTTKSILTWTSGGSATQRSEWGWYSPTGWSRVSYDSWHYDGSTLGFTSTTAHYRNGTFCLTIDTHTYHNVTLFTGYFNGGWEWSYEVDKSGGCTSLLHYEYIVDTP